MRADQLVVERGLAPTRSAAQRLIAHGGVRWRAAGAAPQWAPLRKAGQELPVVAELDVVRDHELRWASRGGLKLEGALDEIGLPVEGLRCLDLGQSTGGFTDVLLARGAAALVGIDVGHGQLHPRLRDDPRVRAFEGVNVRTLDRAREALPDGLAAALADGFDLVVADLSFISLVHALPAVARWLKPAGRALLLVKPQFELEPADIGKGGRVRDPDAAVPRVEARLRAAAAGAGLHIERWMPSPIAGGDGNREHFILLHREATP
jgi:23S rRNA (cytidine1920-2'-O)/16S rRNA (cytidine1409-2'-O)-methyltransferase